MTYDDFKLQGFEEYAEFNYFKGEAENPFNQKDYPVESKWWLFEKNYHDNYKKTGQWKTFSGFLDHWIKEIAAPGSGYDLSQGNWWKKEYEENKPYIISDYSMFRYYKGEAENPFSQEKQNSAHMFWFYESVFQKNFDRWESSDWYDFFGHTERGESFMKLLSDEDYERPTEKKKKPIFEIWLDYLFTEKLYPEYGGKLNEYKIMYYAGNVEMT